MVLRRLPCGLAHDEGGRGVTDPGAPRERDVRILAVLLVDEKRSLTKDLVRKRWNIPERRFRAACSELRLRGVPIVSWSAEDSAYRMAKDAAELDAFIEHELVSRARVLEGQIRALREAAPRYFGVSEQLALISAGGR